MIAGVVFFVVATVGLDDVRIATERHHPTIAAALLDQAAMRGELMAGDGAFDPVVKARALGDVSYYQSGIIDVGVDVPTPLWGTTFTGGWRLGAGDFPIYDGKLKTNDGGEVRLGLLVPLLRDGAIDRRRSTIEKLTLEQRVQDEAVRAARLELLRQASFAYWEWVAAGARLTVADELLALAVTRGAQLDDRVAHGDAASVDQRDNQRLIAQRRARVAAQNRALERAAFELSLYLRDDSGAPRVVTRADLPVLEPAAAVVIDVDLARADAHERRPELRRLAIVGEQLGVDVRLAENQLLPGLSLSASVSQDIGKTSPPLSSSSSVWAPDPKTRDIPDVEVGVGFDLPVPLRQARGRIAVAEAARARLEQQRRLVGDRVSLDVDDARSAAVAAAERVAAAAAEVDAAVFVEAAERVRFDAGDSTLVVVNLREVATAEARLAAAEAGLESRRAEVALAAATARLLDD